MSVYRLGARYATRLELVLLALIGSCPLVALDVDVVGLAVAAELVQLGTFRTVGRMAVADRTRMLTAAGSTQLAVVRALLAVLGMCGLRFVFLVRLLFHNMAVEFASVSRALQEHATRTTTIEWLGAVARQLGHL